MRYCGTKKARIRRNTLCISRIQDKFVAEKIRKASQTQLCGIALDSTEPGMISAVWRWGLSNDFRQSCNAVCVGTLRIICVV